MSDPYVRFMVDKEKDKKMNKVEVTVNTLKYEFALCEICDNHTPRVRVIEDGYSEDGCKYCWEAYGEIN